MGMCADINDTVPLNSMCKIPSRSRSCDFTDQVLSLKFSMSGKVDNEIYHHKGRGGDAFTFAPFAILFH